MYGFGHIITSEEMSAMKIKLFPILAAILIIARCGHEVKGPTMPQVLISKKFIDDNSYRIVCRGFPEEGLTGVQRTESSKRAARLNAYVFIKSEFVDAVAPDRDGRVEKFEVANDYAIIYYVVAKKGLKKMIRPEPKPEPGPRTDTGKDAESKFGPLDVPADAAGNK
jgi:hypothetical protein